MIRVLLAVVLACLCSLILADEQDAKINDIFKDFKKAEDAFADVVRGVDADALDDFDDRIKNAGKRGGVESVERWTQQKKQYIRTRAMNQDDKNARYTRMVLLAAGASGKRKALPHARIMLHQMMGGFSGQAEDIDIQAKEIIKMTDVLNDILSRHTGHKIEEIAEDTQRDYYFSSQEAKDYGIIDEVMQNRKLKAV